MCTGVGCIGFSPLRCVLVCAVPFSVPSIGDGPVVVSLDCSLVVEYVVHCKSNSAYLYNMAIDLHSYANSHG